MTSLETALGLLGIAALAALWLAVCAVCWRYGPLDALTGRRTPTIGRDVLVRGSVWVTRADGLTEPVRSPLGCGQWQADETLQLDPADWADFYAPEIEVRPQLTPDAMVDSMIDDLRERAVCGVECEVSDDA